MGNDVPPKGNGNMLDELNLTRFLTAQVIHVFDPDTFAPVAEVSYGRDGEVTMRHADGREDRGKWGIEKATYWTQYENFRDGGLNRFYVERVDPFTVQAFFLDGRRAFVQSHKPSLSAAGQ